MLDMLHGGEECRGVCSNCLHNSFTAVPRALKAGVQKLCNPCYILRVREESRPIPPPAPAPQVGPHESEFTRITKEVKKVTDSITRKRKSDDELVEEAIRLAASTHPSSIPQQFSFHVRPANVELPKLERQAATAQPVAKKRIVRVRDVKAIVREATKSAEDNRQRVGWEDVFGRSQTESNHVIGTLRVSYKIPNNDRVFTFERGYGAHRKYKDMMDMLLETACLIEHAEAKLTPRDLTVVGASFNLEYELNPIFN